MWTLFGYAVFVAIFGGMLWAKSYRWRYLAESYAAELPPATEKRHMQSVVLIGLGAFNSVKGIVTIGLHPKGVSLKIMPPFSIFHAPLFIPYSDIECWQTSWYLDAQSTELQLRQAPGVKLVMSEEQAKWIQGAAGHRMTLRDERPPQGNAGQGWHAYMVVTAGISVGMSAWLVYYLVVGSHLQ